MFKEVIRIFIFLMFLMQNFTQPFIIVYYSGVLVHWIPGNSGRIPGEFRGIRPNSRQKVPENTLEFWAILGEFQIYSMLGKIRKFIEIFANKSNLHFSGFFWIFSDKFAQNSPGIPPEFYFFSFFIINFRNFSGFLLLFWKNFPIY